MTLPPTITPADLALLRTTAKTKQSNGLFGKGHPPCLTFSSLDHMWELHAYGHIQARSAQPSALYACLWREFLEPGWLVYALSPAADPEEACMDGYTRQRREMDRTTREAIALQRKREEEDASWRKRRLGQIIPEAVSLDDLLED